jgi:hypothetical protein
MNRLSAIAGAVGALFVFSLVTAPMTAQPAAAQAGMRPPEDVRVINGSAEAVPVAVNTLPAVQVGNGAANPIPVTVMNPTTQAFEPFATSGFFLMQGNEISAFPQIYTVPGDKWLVLETATFRTQEDDRFPCTYLITVTQGTVTRSYYLAVDDRYKDNNFVFQQIGTKDVKIYAAPGSVIRFGAQRTQVGVGVAVGWSVAGQLVPAA